MKAGFPMTTCMIRILLLGTVTISAIGCDKTYVFPQPTSPTPITTTPTTPTTPTPTTPRPALDLVEFRVTGDGEWLSPVVVRVSNSVDGLTQVVTVLPYTESFSIADINLAFLSLDARVSGVGFLHAAIYVNGTLFREASSTRIDPVVSVSGTYRRPR